MQTIKALAIVLGWLSCVGLAIAQETTTFPPPGSNPRRLRRTYYGPVMRPNSQPAPCPGYAIRLNVAHSHSVPGYVYPDYGFTHGWTPERSSGRWDPSQARD